MFRSSTAEKLPKDKHLTISISRFPGTIVNVDIGLDHEVDFSDFLAVARQAFWRTSESVKERVTERVRFT